MSKKDELIDQQQETLHELYAERAQARKERDEYRSRWEEAAEEAGQAQEEVACLQEDLDGAKQRISSLITQRNTLYLDLETVRKDRDACEEENAASVWDLKTARATIEELQEDLENAGKDLDTQTEWNEALLQGLKNSRKDRDAHKEMLEASIRDLENARRNEAATAALYQELLRENKDLEQSCKNTEGHLAATIDALAAFCISQGLEARIHRAREIIGDAIEAGEGLNFTGLLDVLEGGSYED